MNNRSDSKDTTITEKRFEQSLSKRTKTSRHQIMYVGAL